MRVRYRGRHRRKWSGCGRQQMTHYGTWQSDELLTWLRPVLRKAAEVRRDAMGRERPGSNLIPGIAMSGRSTPRLHQRSRPSRRTLAIVAGIGATFVSGFLLLILLRLRRLWARYPIARSWASLKSVAIFFSQIADGPSVEHRRTSCRPQQGM